MRTMAKKLAGVATEDWRASHHQRAEVLARLSHPIESGAHRSAATLGAHCLGRRPRNKGGGVPLATSRTLKRGGTGAGSAAKNLYFRAHANLAPSTHLQAPLT